MYWAYSASDETYLQYNPINLLLWHAIEWGHNTKYQKLVMGRTRNNSGVYRFKKKWGGKPVSLPVYYYLLNKKTMPMLDPTKGKYIILTKIWSLFPKIITSRVGSFLRAGLAI